MSTPDGGGGPPGSGGAGPGRRPPRGNPVPLVTLGIAVIVVCVVVLFTLSSGGSDAAALQTGDCLPAESDAAVPCADDEAAYRVLETREDVLAAEAPTVCADVDGVLAYGWEGPAGRPGTALCLGPV
ncbi:LppU/SCO3897 family protein [Modestobacter sp. URMC 112]